MVKKNILFFGNCQSLALGKCLNLDDSYNIQYLRCYNTNINKKEFTNLLDQQDIIITQAIDKNYKGFDYLNTFYIVNNTKAIVIIFNCCYFEFYYPDLKYIKNKNNDKIAKPIDYHYQHMIDYYKKDDTVENYIKNCVNNSSLYSQEYLLEKASISINNLKKKEKNMVSNFCEKNNVYLICISDYIEKNFKEKLLFYSMNHPTKYIFHHIGENIIKILNIKNTINYNIDPLDNVRCILYKCVENVINFENKNDIKMFNFTDLYSITKNYFETYDKIKLLEKIK